MFSCQKAGMKTTIARAVFRKGVIFYESNQNEATWAPRAWVKGLFAVTVNESAEEVHQLSHCFTIEHWRWGTQTIGWLRQTQREHQAGGTESKHSLCPPPPRLPSVCRPVSGQHGAQLSGRSKEISLSLPTESTGKWPDIRPHVKKDSSLLIP